MAHIVGVARCGGGREFGVAGGRVGWGAARPGRLCVAGVGCGGRRGRCTARVRGRLAGVERDAEDGGGGFAGGFGRGVGEERGECGEGVGGCDGRGGAGAIGLDAAESRHGGDGCGMLGPVAELLQGDAVGLCERVERDARLEVVGEQRGEPR